MTKAHWTALGALAGLAVLVVAALVSPGTHVYNTWTPFYTWVANSNWSTPITAFIFYSGPLAVFIWWKHHKAELLAGQRHETMMAHIHHLKRSAGLSAELPDDLKVSTGLDSKR